MKTFKDITHVNYQELAFFKSISVPEAKLEIAGALNIKKFNKKGIPVVGINDKAPVEKLNFAIRSNSRLDGYNRLEYLVNYFNKGIDMNLFRLYGESPAFIKKIKFVGKFQILSEIMNPEQYRKLQEIWLFSHLYNKEITTREADAFIKNNVWAKDFLKSKGMNLKERV